MTMLSNPGTPSHDETVTRIESSLGTDVHSGLSAQQVRERQALWGPNVIPEGRRVSPIQRLLAQFRDPQVYLLLAAAAVSMAVSVLEQPPRVSSEAMIILAIVVLNAVLGFAQEGRAERAMASLRAMVPAEATVIRDGSRQRLKAREIVPGDLLIIREGDSIPADAQVIQAKAFQTMEAALTGESLPVAKDPGRSEPAAVIADRTNMIFAGTTAISGHACAVVTATGLRTEFGKIAELVRSAGEQATPLQGQLKRLSKLLFGAVIGIAAVVIITLLSVHRVDSLAGVVQILIFGIALSVAATPEGLAAIITVVLAVGVQRMARRGAIVRKLPAVETLGSATVIASDKTGTMTANEMTVRVLVTASGCTAVSGSGYAPDGKLTDGRNQPLSPEQEKEVLSLLEASVLVNNAQLNTDGRVWHIHGDPTEAALLSVAGKARLDPASIQAQYPRAAEIAFSSERKMMSTLHRNGQYPEELVVFTKGAPDVLLEHCTHELTAGGNQILTPLRRKQILSENTRLAEDSLRTLGVATRILLSQQAFDAENIDEPAIERDLVFIGLAGMMDPPRPQVRPAIEKAKVAGIRTILITGDHPRTALAIAQELGIEDKELVLTGSQLDQMPDAACVEAVRKVGVYARVTPEHKLRIVRALQQDGEVVAMTGDGVNDAPALKKAQIGIAMGTGTDVSKEAADLILTDDNFATIVAAVEEGRVVVDNIRKFIRYLLATNSGEVLTIFLGVLMLSRSGGGLSHLLLPLSAAQILWMNLVTDGAPALALGVDPSSPNIMRRPPRPVAEGLIDRPMMINIVLVAITMALGTLWVFFTGSPGAPDQRSQTLAFNTIILCQLFNSMSARSSTRSVFHDIFGNRWLWGAILLSLGAQLLMLSVTAVRVAFSLSPLSWRDWAYCGAIASSVLWASELEKYIVRRTRKPGPELRQNMAQG